MEDEERIGLILARATELRLKITDCIDISSSAVSEDGGGDGGGNEDPSQGEMNANRDKDFDSISSDNVDEDDKEEEESERLLRIRDALESLESQLSSLQNLRQRQQYEKQVALSEIDYSRKMLLEKLKEYKGKEFEVIREASTFADERVDYENNDLLLPPYHVHPPPINLGLDNNNNGYVSHLPIKQRHDTNGFSSREETSPEKSSSNGVVRFLGSVVKIVIPIIGVISILSASGYGPEIKKRGGGASLKLLGLLPQRVGRGKKGARSQCPDGKVLVVEDGEARCLVKERVEIPFDSVVVKRDVTYGYG
ncbi:unnamed protein product [Cochlearia groenlandica]